MDRLVHPLALADVVGGPDVVLPQKCEGAAVKRA